MKAKPPKVPNTLVEIGRCVELGFENKLWKWTVRDNFILTSSESGKRIFIFERPKTTDKPPAKLDRAKKLYNIFHGRKYDEYLQGKLYALRSKVGRAIHVVYNSDKFGPRRDYIHHFVSQPIVWADRVKNPRIVALTGGHIRITARGIEG
jgi:hypothetical protein